MCTTGIEITFLVGAILATTAGVMVAEDSAQGQRKMARYQSRALDVQAQAAQSEADNARKLAQYDADNLRREFLRAQGSQRSLLATSGADMADGSAMDVLLENASQARKDQEFRLYQGNMDAWRSQNQVQSLLMDSEESKMQAANSRVSGWTYVKAASSVASSALAGA